MQQRGQLPNVHSTRDESAAEFALNDHEAGNSMEEKGLSIALVNHPMPRKAMFCAYWDDSGRMNDSETPVIKSSRISG